MSNESKLRTVTALLCDLVRAYEREVRPASDWRDTALTEEEWEEVTKEYRAAKKWLEEQ